MSNYSMCPIWTQKIAAQIRAAFALFIVRCAELLTDLINASRGEAGDDTHGDGGYVVGRGEVRHDTHRQSAQDAACGSADDGDPLVIHLFCLKRRTYQLGYDVYRSHSCYSKVHIYSS